MWFVWQSGKFRGSDSDSEFGRLSHIPLATAGGNAVGEVATATSRGTLLGGVEKYEVLGDSPKRASGVCLTRARQF